MDGIYDHGEADGADDCADVKGEEALGWPDVAEEDGDVDADYTVVGSVNRWGMDIRARLVGRYVPPIPGM